MDVLALIREDAKVLEPLQYPALTGRLLPAVGFVFGDSFDTLLKNISEDYLRTAWLRLSEILRRNSIQCEDLCWGYLHPGETDILGAPRGIAPSKPSDFIGWTSCDLYESWMEQNLNGTVGHYLDLALKSDFPSLRCTNTWRSHAWKIKPDNYPLALRLIEHLCTEDLPSWIPQYLLENVEQPRELWHRIAQSFETGNQPQLDVLVEEARQSYTSLGFRILLRGFGSYLHSGAYKGELSLPELE